MRKLLLAAAIAFGALFLASGPSSAQFTSHNGDIVINYAEVEMFGPDTDPTLVFSGDVELTAVDRKSGTVVKATSSKMTVNFVKGGSTVNALSAIKSAQLTEPAKIVYTSPQPAGKPVTTIATARQIIYSGVDMTAEMSGDVNICYDNPALFSGTMTGDTASVNLDPDLGPNDYRFRMASSPGVSRIEATPKPKEDTK